MLSLHARRIFQKDNYTAIGETIKLGIAAFHSESFIITDIFGAPRPITKAKFPDWDRKELIETFKVMKIIIEDYFNLTK